MTRKARKTGPEAEHDRQAAPSAPIDPHATTEDVDDRARSAETGGGDSEALARLQAENAELKDRLLRALAEVENVRRRAERDLDDMRQYAVTKFAGDVLSIADNLERAVTSIPVEVRKSAGAVKTLVDGIELIEKEMLNVLEKHGVRKLNPVGERFDPNFHEALFEVPDPILPSGTVSQVVEPGYSLGSRPLRAAKVGIARGGA